MNQPNYNRQLSIQNPSHNKTAWHIHQAATPYLICPLNDLFLFVPRQELCHIGSITILYEPGRR